MRIATLNVNGIRAATKRNFGDWLDRRNCDVVALQEMRCPVDAVPDGLFGDYHLAYHPGDLAGRNGVALATRGKPRAVRYGTGNHQFDHEGRYIEVDLDVAGQLLVIGSLYLPKGSTIEENETKYRRKMRFMASFARYLRTARLRATRAGGEFLVMGDFNIAHTRQDLKNATANRRNEGFLPEEREWIGQQQSPRTLIDVVRHLHPHEQGPYSWWSWRGQAFTNDAGWRIDYHLATPGLARTAVIGGTDRDASYEERLSDHAPVVVDYDWPPAQG